MPPPDVLVGSRPATGSQRAVLAEREALAPIAEPVALERQRDQRAERVVELGDVDVGRADVGVLPQQPGARPRPGPQRVVAEVVRHRLVLLRDRLRERVDEHRRSGQVARSLGRA